MTRRIARGTVLPPDVAVRFYSFDHAVRCGVAHSAGGAQSRVGEQGAEFVHVYT